MANEKDCPFCRITSGSSNPVKVYEDEDVLAIMDLYPATPWHILVLPKKHVENIYSMPYDLGSHIMRAAIKISQAVKRQLSPDGLNLIQSNELAAGQTVPRFHLHVVPRYKTDAVILKFGHGNMPNPQKELELVAKKVRSALSND